MQHLPCTSAASKFYHVDIIDLTLHISAAIRSRSREIACNTGTLFELERREAHLLVIDGGTNAFADLTGQQNYSQCPHNRKITIMRNSIKTFVAAAALVGGLASANAAQVTMPSSLENTSAVQSFNAIPTTTITSAFLNSSRQSADAVRVSTNTTYNAQDPARGVNSGR